MEPLDPLNSIRRLGFKRWYERQLIDSHLSLVTALLAGILIAICIEGVSLKHMDAASLKMLGIIFVMGAIAIGAARRFAEGLRRAEQYASKSTCPSCETYAKFEVLSSFGPRLRVRCMKCPSEWHLG